MSEADRRAGATQAILSYFHPLFVATGWIAAVVAIGISGLIVALLVLR